MVLVNIDYIPGKEFEVLGMAKGTVVQSQNFGTDFMAGRRRDHRVHRDAQRGTANCR